MMDRRSDLVFFNALFQVPKVKKSAVRIALVPDDVGKPTFKLEKVAVEDGTCLWETPVYVTVKLIKDSKTGNIKEKIYHFIVSTVSSVIPSSVCLVFFSFSEWSLVGISDS